MDQEQLDSIRTQNHPDPALVNALLEEIESRVTIEEVRAWLIKQGLPLTANEIDNHQFGIIKTIRRRRCGACECIIDADGCGCNPHDA